MDLKTTSSRVLWTCLLLVLAAGHAFAASQIYFTAGVAPQNILEHYQGNEHEMIAPLTVERLVMLSHAHLLTMPWVLFPAALLFTRNRRWTEPMKALVIGASFVGLAMDVGAWWGVRFWGAPMLLPLFLGGGLFGGGFVLMTVSGLLHIWRNEE